MQLPGMMSRIFFVILGYAVLIASIPLQAHEIDPTIADLHHKNGEVQLSFRLDAESFLVGINLDDFSNTEDIPDVSEYEKYRNLSADALKGRLQQAGTNLFPGFELSTGKEALKLHLAYVEVPHVPEPDLARVSHIILTGPLPEGTDFLNLHWGVGLGPMILRQQGVGDPFTTLLEGGQNSGPIPLSGGGAFSGWQSFLTYIPVGFDHIIPKGLDHILFVFGLFFLSTRLRPLLWQITAFTFAHTVTLALGSLGIVNVPGNIVEPLIAASIVYVAVENILSGKLGPWRPVIVFMFGLLHGLGFASVLENFGLPDGTFLPALIGFNIGVEFGQLCVIALAFFAVGLWFAKKPWYRARIANPASALIALIGTWWVIERVFLS